MSNVRLSANSLVINATGVDSSIPPGSISASGNITGGNLVTSGIVKATSIVANVVAATVTTTANVQGGNLRTAGLISAFGNITGGNLFTVGSVSAQNTIYAPSASITGGITAGTLNVGTLTLASVSTAGNVTGGNILTRGNMSTSGNNISGGNVAGLNLSTLNATGVINGGSLSVYGSVQSATVSASGNVRAGAFLNTNGSPYQSPGGPAFNAQVLTGQSFPYAPSGGIFPLWFDNVQNSTGGGYTIGNATTGSRFVAPIAGYYQVSAAITVQPANWSQVQFYSSGAGLGIIKNSQAIASGPFILYAKTTVGSTTLQIIDASSTSCLVYLNAGDILFCELIGLSNAPNGFWSTNVTSGLKGYFQACWLRS